MRYTTKQKIKKYARWILAAVVILVVNLWVFLIIQPITQLEKRMIPLDVSIYTKVYPYDDGIVAIDQKEIIWFDLKGIEQHRAELPDYDMQAFCNGKATVVWNNITAQIYNDNGTRILEKQLLTPESEILFARTGEDFFAMATIEEGQYKARIYNYEANDIDDMLFPYQSMLDLGFFGDTGRQLWALLLDSHGTIPITKVRTDHPGKSMTGSITILNQVCYDIMPLRDEVYIVGTHHIQSYSYTSVKLSEQLVYGWTMQDYMIDKNEISFLMGTTQDSEYRSPISALWYIGSNDTQFRVSLPTDITDTVLTQKNIYAFSNDGIYIYDITKQRKSFDKLSFGIEEVMGNVRGKAVVLRSSDQIYLLPLQ